MPLCTPASNRYSISGCHSLSFHPCGCGVKLGGFILRFLGDLWDCTLLRGSWRVFYLLGDGAVCSLRMCKFVISIVSCRSSYTSQKPFLHQLPWLGTCGSGSFLSTECFPKRQEIYGGVLSSFRIFGKRFKS